MYSFMSNKPFVLLQAALTPSEIIAEDNPICIYIDAIRASATVVSFFDMGVKQLRLCEDEEKILAEDETIDRDKYLICAEDVPGDCAPMADCSPSVIGVRAMNMLKDRMILFHTTNGTRGILQLYGKGIHDIYVGTVLNMDAVVKRVVNRAIEERRPICIVDSGRYDCRIATLDDAYCTAKLASRIIDLLKEKNCPYELMDPIKICLHLLNGFENTFEAYKASSTAIKCAAHISTEDVAMCASENISRFVPYVSSIDRHGCVIIDADIER